MSEKSYCMGCMQELDPQATICPNCHLGTEIDNKPTHIRPGTTVCDRYLIGKSVAVYNDSVIYIALDKVTEEAVTVYEFFPEKLASRDGDRIHIIPSAERQSLYNGCMQSFLGLWRGIKMFNDVRPLPCVTDIIEANGTAYAIAEHKDTVALKDYFAKTRRPLSANKAVSAFLPLLNALKLLHNAGIVHGNLNPSTIQVGADGRLNIIGFSIPQCRSNIPEIAAKPVSGFSPIEIYKGNGATAQSDIYSVMSVMYYSVTGTVLPRATERVNSGRLSMSSSIAQSIPRSVLDAFTKALAVQPENRLKKTDELIAILNQSKAVTATPVQRTAAPVSKPPVSAPEEPAAPSYSEYAAPDYNGETQVISTPVTSTKPSPVPQAVPQNEYPEEEEEEYDEEEYKEDTLIERKQIPLPVLGGLTCVAVIFICFILFAVLYATVLYKSIEVPMFDNMFSSISFLPMNKDNNAADPVTPDMYEEETTAGTTYVTVPDFTQFTEEYVRANVSFQNNFDIIYSYESSTEVEKGGIISQSVHKNESVLTGTTIQLVISTGQPEIQVPDVLEKTYEEAKEILREAGFKVSKEIIDNPDNNPSDTVSNMSIEPGKLAAKGTEIILYVWDEIEETTTEVTTTEPTTKETTTKESTTKETTTEPTTKETTTKQTTTKETTTKESTTKETTTEAQTTTENTVEE